MNNTRQIQTLIGTMTAAALVSAAYAAFVSHTLHSTLAVAILVMAAGTSRMKAKLPGINGNMSVNLPFLLTAIATLSAAEAIVITAISTAVQCWPRKNGKFNPQQITFNLSMMIFASSLASLMFHASWWTGRQAESNVLQLILATATLFLGQTVPVSTIVGLSEGKSAASVWWELAHLCFPYYVVSVGVTFMAQTMSSHLGWGLALTVFPVMYAIHRCYSLYFGRITESLRPQGFARGAVAGA